jgi:hypothetical protein
MFLETFEFFLSLATFFVRNSSYHPGVYEVPSWLGVLDTVLGRARSWQAKEMLLRALRNFV